MIHPIIYPSATSPATKSLLAGKPRNRAAGNTPRDDIIISAQTAIMAEQSALRSAARFQASGNSISYCPVKKMKPNFSTKRRADKQRVSTFTTRMVSAAVA